VQFTKDGKSLLSAGDDAKVLLWDLSTQQLRETFGPFQSEISLREKKQGALQLPYPMLDLSAAGKVVALKKGGGGLSLFDLGAGKLLRSFGSRQLTEARFSPDGKLLAVPSDDDPRTGGLEIWDVAAGEVFQRIEATFSIKKFSFSPDSKLLVTGHLDAMKKSEKKSNLEKAPDTTFLTIGIWDLAAAKRLHEWTSQTEGQLAALVFSPDGDRIAAAREDGGVQIWAPSSGKELVHVLGPKKMAGRPYEGPFALAFSPGGRILAVAWNVNPRSENGVRTDTWSLQLLEGFSGQEIRKFELEMKSGHCLAFAPDGRTLACSKGESTILLWDLTGRQNNARSQVKPPSAKEIDGLWADLASDAAKAEPAIWTLVFSPSQSLPVLKRGLKLSVAPADDVAKLVADLDTKQFASRQKAIASLIEMSLAAESTVNKIMAGGLPLEQQQRLKPFLERCRLETLRQLRAVDVLDQIGTEQAKELLAALAKSSPSPQVSQFATAALERYAKAVAR
jgi:WD40 repeat protein